MEENGIIIHTDGGSRGNPGPAACGFVVEEKGKVLHKGHEFLGKATNNFAEYRGVVAALNWLNGREKIGAGKKVTFYLDSELIVRQINGAYKVKDENLKKLFTEVLTLLAKSGREIVFKNIPRAQNKVADLLVNKSLDENS